jgi:ADP-ribose pyrophosphatase YjhB (NUDIX family)
MYKVFINNKSLIFTNIDNTSYNAENELFLEYDYEIDLINEFEKLKINDKIKNLIILVKEDVEKVFNKFLSNFTILEAGGGLVINENNEYLLIFRLGKWDLPKGKAEKGEDIESTALREVEEETALKGAGIISKMPETYHYYEHKSRSIIKRTYWFLMSASSKDQILQPQIKEDIQKVEWMTKAQVCKALKNSYRSIIELVDRFFDG